MKEEAKKVRTKKSPNKQNNLEQNDENLAKHESRPKTYTKQRFEKNVYKCRTSLLDDCSQESYVNNSAFKGFINLGKLIALAFIITTPIVITISLFSLKFFS